MSSTTITAPVAGWLMNVREVSDPVFSEEMMGTGIAIDPTEGLVVAPCDAEVLLVAPTRHSVTLRTTDGAELMIHIGLETVGLEGRGFQTHVRDGERVAAGDPLISFDLDTVGLEAKSLVTPIVLTNADAFRWSFDGLDRLVERGETIGAIESDGVSGEAAVTSGEFATKDAFIRFPHGLHARPAARIADCAKRYSSDVTIAVGEKRANARSPVAIMALNAQHEDRVTLSAKGTDADKALRAIVEILDAGESAEPVIPSQPGTRALAANEIGGVCALPGVVLGTAAHWRRQIAEASETGQGIEHERVALGEAREAVRHRLEALSKGMAGPGSAIASAHIGLLDDDELNAAATAEIVAGKSAAKAWQNATRAAADALRSSGSALVRERVADLDDICSQVLAALAGEERGRSADFGEGTILIADELLPSELLSLPRDRIVGLATAGGGPTSHMAIIAASFGIPTLVALGPRLASVPEGTAVLLDATSGVLVVEPDEAARARAAGAAEQSSGGDCLTRDGERIRLLANLGGVGEVDGALAAGAEGCGLLRTEFLFLDRAEAPSQAEQRDAYQAIADALDNRPLTIRTLDIGGDKPVPYIHFPEEQNPALGARGVRTSLFSPELIDEQLRAIAEVRGDAIKVMLPMVSSVDELRSVRDRLNALRSGITLGIMVETPAAALIADRLAEKADFFSIGSNDLAQYVLAMDRTNPLLATSIDGLHPAVLRLIAMTVEAGRKAGKPVSLCGSLASEPIGALLLVGLGIRELSGVPAALPAVRAALSSVTEADCRLLAERALTLESAGDVRLLAAGLLQGDAR